MAAVVLEGVTALLGLRLCFGRVATGQLEEGFGAGLVLELEATNGAIATEGAVPATQPIGAGQHGLVVLFAQVVGQLHHEQVIAVAGVLGGDDLAARGLPGCAHLGLGCALAGFAGFLGALGGQRVVLDALLRRQRQEGVSRALAFADVLGDDGFEVGQRLRVFHSGGLGGALGLGFCNRGLPVLGVLLQFGVVRGLDMPAHGSLKGALTHAVAQGVAQHKPADHLAVDGVDDIGLLLAGVSHLNEVPARLEQFRLGLGFQLGQHGILVRHQRFKRCLELLGRGLAFAHRFHQGFVSVNGRGLAGGLCFWCSSRRSWNICIELASC